QGERPLAPRRSSVEELRTSHAEQEDSASGSLGDVLQQIEEGRLRPVDVLEDRDEGTIGRQELEELPDRREELVGPVHVRVQTDRARDLCRDRRAVLLLRKSLGQRG